MSKFATVLVESVTARASPGGTEVGILHKGARCQVIRSEGPPAHTLTWHLVKTTTITVNVWIAEKDHGGNRLLDVKEERPAPLPPLPDYHPVARSKQERGFFPYFLGAVVAVMIAALLYMFIGSVR